jgi:hypothetical protein
MSDSDEAAGPESMSPDRAFDLLRDGTRRRVLRTLRETDGAMALGELAAAADARDEGVPAEEISMDRRERTAVSLHHCHLPKLADAGVVEYDPVANRASATERVEELTPYFDVLD